MEAEDIDCPQLRGNKLALQHRSCRAALTAACLEAQLDD